MGIVSSSLLWNYASRDLSFFHRQVRCRDKRVGSPMSQEAQSPGMSLRVCVTINKPSSSGFSVASCESLCKIKFTRDSKKVQCARKGNCQWWFSLTLSCDRPALRGEPQPSTLTQRRGHCPHSKGGSNTSCDIKQRYLSCSGSFRKNFHLSTFLHFLIFPKLFILNWFTNLNHA